MRLSCQIAVLLLSMVGTTTAQQNKSYLTEPGAKRKYSGLSHIEADLGQRNTLLVGFDRFEQIQARRNVDSVLRLFVADYQKVQDTTQSSTRSIHALFRLGETDQALELRYTAEPTALFLFRDEQPVQVKIQQDTLQIVWGAAISRSIPQDFSLYLFVNSISDIKRILAQGGVNSKLNAALESVRQYKGHDLTSPKMSFDMIRRSDGKAMFLSPGLAKNPFISFQPGIGIGFIRSEGTASINLDLQFVPSRFRKVGYTIGYTSNFFFGGSRSDFLNVGMAFYRGDKNGRTVTFSQPVATFYVGYTIYDGREFGGGGRTIRLGGTVFQKGLFKVQPELYTNLNGGGEAGSTFYPGLRLVVGL